MGSTFPFELLSGNHEDGGDYQDGLIDTFVQCLPDRLGAVGTYGKEYYFDYPASSPIARFIMISPSLTFTNGGYYSYAAGTTHYNWVANTIDNARAAGIKWVIVAMHKPCISMGIMPCDIGNDIFNLLVSKKVDLILQAHAHDYQRSKQLALNSTTCTAIQAETYNSNCVVNDGSTGNYTQGLGPVTVIIGTVGEGLHTINTSDGDAGYFAKWMGNNINPTNGLTEFDEKDNLLAVLTPVFAGTTLPKEPNRVIHTDAPPEAVAITNDGLLGFIAFRGGKVAMLDLLRRQVAYTVDVGGTPHFVITGLYPPSTHIIPPKAPAKQASMQGLVMSNIPVIMACVLAIAFLVLVLILLLQLPRFGPKKWGSDSREGISPENSMDGRARKNDSRN